ncbi:hypothetical protein AB4511_27225, partial [Vibrio sp. 10N.222.54.F6]
FAIALNAKARFAFQKPNELLSEPEKDSDDEIKTRVDWDGLSARLWQVPVAAGNYSSLQLGEDKLYLLDKNVESRKSSLKVVKFNPLSPKVDTFSKDVGSYTLSSDSKKLFIRKQ